MPMSLPDVSAIKKLEVENNLSFWSEADYVSELERDDSIALVAKTSGNLSGFIISRLITSQIVLSDNFSMVKESEVEIYNLAVKREFRGIGIGKILLKKSLEYYSKDNISNIWLDVRESNLVAQEFYMKQGFEVIYERKNFYRDPVEDGLVMCWNLRK